MSPGTRKSERDGRPASLEIRAWFDPQTGQIHLVSPSAAGFHSVVTNDRNSSRASRNFYAQLMKAFEEAGVSVPNPMRFRLGRVPNEMTRWEALVRYDDEIYEAAMKLLPFGSVWVDRLGEAFSALGEDRSYLSKIVEQLREEAILEAREAERNEAVEWLRTLATLPGGEQISREGLAILVELRIRGYQIVKQSKDITVSLDGCGTSYVRSNDDIRQLAGILQAHEPAGRHDALSTNSAEPRSAPRIELQASLTSLLPLK